VFPSFTNPVVFKTDAPVDFLRTMKLEWEKSCKDKDYKSHIDFSDNAEIKLMLKNAPPRFLPNPEKNWGPKSAAKIKQTRDKPVKNEEEELAKKLEEHDIVGEEHSNHKKVKLN
jgi:hypothetical protein